MYAATPCLATVSATFTVSGSGFFKDADLNGWLLRSTGIFAQIRWRHRCWFSTQEKPYGRRRRSG